MWQRVLSIVGDIASILAVPSLVLVYIGLWKLYGELRAQRRPKGVSEDAVEFAQGGVAINLVPIAKLQFLPRKGDTVMLPSEQGAPDAGAYDVTDVCHIYWIDDDENGPCPARLKKIVASVKKKGG